MSGKRAAWKPAMEQTLLELFGKARQDLKLRTDRGLKKRGWESIAEQINKSCASSFNVDQIKSKHARLMMDYALFVEVGGEGSLTDEDWDKIIAKKPEYTVRLRHLKEHGCPHIETYRRIVALKVSAGGEASTRKAKATHKPRTKRSSRSEGEKTQTKKARVEVGKKVREWSLLEEKLLLFLYWKAKTSQKMCVQDTLGAQGWADLTAELNKLCTAQFKEKEAKGKYAELMQRYNEFKLATGFSGVPGSAPKDEMDWERLIRERPGYYTELEKLKDGGGFSHVRVCSLIEGDTPPNGMGPASVSEFLATGEPELLRPVQSLSQTQSPAHAIASAQASLSANALSQLLPATANIVASFSQPTTNALQGNATIPVSTAGAPAVFSQELHDNLNMFLKTATAYLVMLIDDHNQQS